MPCCGLGLARAAHRARVSNPGGYRGYGRTGVGTGLVGGLEGTLAPTLEGGWKHHSNPFSTM